MRAELRFRAGLVCSDNGLGRMPWVPALGMGFGPCGRETALADGGFPVTFAVLCRGCRLSGLLPGRRQPIPSTTMHAGVSAGSARAGAVALVGFGLVAQLVRAHA